VRFSPTRRPRVPPQQSRRYIPTCRASQVKKRGAPPDGGGDVFFTCAVVKRLQPVQLLDQGLVRRIRGVAYSARVSPQTDNRVRSTVAPSCRLSSPPRTTHPLPQAHAARLPRRGASLPKPLCALAGLDFRTGGRRRTGRLQRTGRRCLHLHRPRVGRGERKVRLAARPPRPTPTVVRGAVHPSVHEAAVGAFRALEHCACGACFSVVDAVRGSAADGRTAECDHVPCHVRNAQSGMQHSVRRTVPYVAGKRGNVARLQRHMLLCTLHAAGCQLLCVRSHRPAGLPCRCGLPCCEIGPAGLRGTGCLWWRRRRPGTHRAHGASHRRLSIKRHLSRSCGQSIGPVRLQHSTQVLILGRWHRLALVLAGGCRHRSRQGAMRGNCDGICLRSAVPPAEPLRASDAIGVGCPFTALHCTALHCTALHCRADVSTARTSLWPSSSCHRQLRLPPSF
jgi:hypothetical protein